jgi:hypothetical protein
MGRYRKLPEINSRTLRFQRHAERAAINTPIQVQGGREGGREGPGPWRRFKRGHGPGRGIPKSICLGGSSPCFIP